MGYDMYWRAPREDDNAGLAEAQKAFDEAVRARNAFPHGSPQAIEAQKLVETTYTGLNSAERTYYRLNVWGMSRARELMNERGMLCTPGEIAYDEWPEYVEEGTPERARYEAERDVLLAAHRGECPGIPVHKLCSNDGWLVLPGEITAALAANDKHAPPADVEWWPEWIDWLRDAIDRDGFEVR